MAIVFEVDDVWGVPVRFTARRWEKLLEKHGELPELAAIDEARLLELVRLTIAKPHRVFEGKSAPDSKVFYSKSGVLAWSVPRYRGVRIAVVVRYTNLPASIPTIYFSVGHRANLGKLLYPEE